MTGKSSNITSTALIATASQVLKGGGFQQVETGFPGWDTPTCRLFEDSYSVVGVCVFETCTELRDTWPELQGSLVDLISANVGRDESKSWDGYLALLTPAMAPLQTSDIEEIRYNTHRLRKLVATGEDLRAAQDVERVFRSLLPIGQEDAGITNASALDLLPKLLSHHGIREEITVTLVKAFREQASLVERLHEYIKKQ